MTVVGVEQELRASAAPRESFVLFWTPLGIGDMIRPAPSKAAHETSSPPPRHDACAARVRAPRARPAADARQDRSASRAVDGAWQGGHGLFAGFDPSAAG